jgi:hypothetical protein
MCEARSHFASSATIVGMEPPCYHGIPWYSRYIETSGRFVKGRSATVDCVGETPSVILRTEGSLSDTCTVLPHHDALPGRCFVPQHDGWLVSNFYQLLATLIQRFDALRNELGPRRGRC